MGRWKIEISGRAMHPFQLKIARNEWERVWLRSRLTLQLNPHDFLSVHEHLLQLHIVKLRRMFFFFPFSCNFLLMFSLFSLKLGECWLLRSTLNMKPSENIFWLSASPQHRGESSEFWESRKRCWASWDNVESIKCESTITLWYSSRDVSHMHAQQSSRSICSIFSINTTTKIGF